MITLEALKSNLFDKHLFCATALRSWLLAQVSHLIAATRIADLYRRF